MVYGFFKKHTIIRRSFEIISLYLGPVQTLNMVLAPVIYPDSKYNSRKEKERLVGQISIDLGGKDAAARRAIIPDSPALLRVRPSLGPGAASSMGAGEEKTAEAISFQDFVRANVQSLFEKWEPTWWLNSGHLQTFWSSAGNFADVDPIEYDRTLLELPDGGLIAVDFTAPESESIPDETPIVVILPGLTGGSQASYVRTLLAQTSKSRSEGGLGLRGVVVNSRGCGNVPLRTPQISAGSPDDLRSALLFVREKYPSAPLYAVGFSLGGTVLAKYLGQEGDASEIQAGCVLACPWDLQRNSDELEREFIGKHVYSKALAKSYLALLHRSLPGLSIDSDHAFHSHLEVIKTLRSPTFTTVNTHLTAIIGGSAPDFPHASVHDFYAWASCAKDIAGVRVPLLAINADDDPIVQILPEAEIRQQSAGCVMMVVTHGGGHLGWFHGKDAKRRWISTPIVQWLRAVQEQVVYSPDAPGAILDDGTARRIRKRVKSEDGFISAEGEKDEIGYRVFEGDASFVERRGSATSNASGDTSVPGAFAGL